MWHHICRKYHSMDAVNTYKSFIKLFVTNKVTQERWSEYISCIHRLAHHFKLKSTSVLITIFDLFMDDPYHYGDLMEKFHRINKSFLTSDLFKLKFLKNTIDDL